MFNSLMYKQLFYSFNDRYLSSLTDCPCVDTTHRPKSDEVLLVMLPPNSSGLIPNMKISLKSDFPAFFCSITLSWKVSSRFTHSWGLQKNCRRALWVLLAQQWGWETWLGTRKQAAVVHRHLIYEGFWRWKLLRERIQDPTHDQNLELK